ncbi:hypothetical protein ACLB2K_002697 [Fragaria x ananassa]
MASTGAISSSKDRPIYARVMGIRRHSYWYVIEEKSSPTESSDEVIGCESERDRVRRLSLPDEDLLTSNVAVLNSRLYLISGYYDPRVGYRHISVDSGVKEMKWQEGFGELAYPKNGGAAVGPDGYIYSVGERQYRFRLGEWEQLPVPPQGWSPFLSQEFLHSQRLLALTKKKLYVYTESRTNIMLSFDLESGKWDEGSLDDNFEGYWSPGVVLYDRYLFSLGTRSPKLNSEIIAANKKRDLEGKQKILEEEVGGVYVFDLEKRQWLHEPVQGLPKDGTVIPWNFQPLPKSYTGRRFNPYLYQIREDEDHHLALLWDSPGSHPPSGGCSLTWCKFIVKAHSLSRGFCQLDEDNYMLLNCALGM